MDKDLLRIVLAVIGVLLLLGIYLWDRIKKRKHTRTAEEPAAAIDTEPDSGLFSLNPAEQRALKVDSDLAIASIDDAIHRVHEEDEKEDETGMAPGVHNKDERIAATEMPTLIQLSVVASPGSAFSGDCLIQTLTDLGLEYGEMEIFHRYDKASDTRVFSIASMVEPGTFPLDEISLFQCPGLLLFFQPLDVPDPVTAFDDMIETSHELKRRLGGHEWDSKHHPLTEEAIEAQRASLIHSVGGLIRQSGTTTNT